MKHIAVNFSSGIVDDDFAYRSDVEKAVNGASVIDNFLPTIAGGLKRRPGTRRIGRILGNKVKMFEFSDINADHGVMIFTAGQIYVLASDGIVKKGEAILTIKTPYTDDDIDKLSIAQSNKYVYVACEGKPVYRIDINNNEAQFEIVRFASALKKPWLQKVESYNTEPDLATRRYEYVITGVDSQGKESTTSDPLGITNQLLNTGSKNTLIWEALEGAESYNVYRKTGGVYALLGNTRGTTFVDLNYAADSSKQPSFAEKGLFETKGNYPSFVTFVQNRLVLAATKNEPNTFWMSRVGKHTDFSKTPILAADERIKLTLQSNKVYKVTGVAATNKIVVFTKGGEWVLGGEPFTPSSVSAQIQSNIGSNGQFQTIGSSMLFADYSGKKVYEAGYNWQAGGFISGNLSIFCNSISKGKKIKRIERINSPVPYVFVLYDDGSVAGFLYIQEQALTSWFTMSMQQHVMDVCRFSRNGNDLLVLAVKSKDGQLFIQELDFETGTYIDDHILIKGNDVKSVSGFDEGQYRFAIHSKDNVFRGTQEGDTVTFDSAVEGGHIGKEYKSTLKMHRINIPQPEIRALNKINVRSINVAYKGDGNLSYIWAGKAYNHVLATNKEFNGGARLSVYGDWDYSDKLQLSCSDGAINIAAIIIDYTDGDV